MILLELEARSWYCVLCLRLSLDPIYLILQEVSSLVCDRRHPAQPFPQALKAPGPLLLGLSWMEGGASAIGASAFGASASFFKVTVAAVVVVAEVVGVAGVPEEVVEVSVVVAVGGVAAAASGLCFCLSLSTVSSVSSLVCDRRHPAQPFPQALKTPGPLLLGLSWMEGGASAFGALAFGDSASFFKVAGPEEGGGHPCLNGAG